MNAEQNYRLLCEIEANRVMLLAVYRQNPQLLATLDERMRQLVNLTSLHAVEKSSGRKEMQVLTPPGLASSPDV